MGYPMGFYDSTHNLPLFRNAMIATTFKVGFQRSPQFLTDANLHCGTSGSPVFTKPKSTWVDDEGNTNLVPGGVYYLVGVHSGVLSASSTRGQSLGLGAAWYIELVEEIALQF